MFNQLVKARPAFSVASGLAFIAIATNINGLGEVGSKLVLPVVRRICEMPSLTEEKLRQLAAHGVDSGETLKFNEDKPKPGEHGRHGYTTLSYACKINRHHMCVAKKCQCKCGHY